jgi:hypothetical protein
MYDNMRELAQYLYGALVMIYAMQTVDATTTTYKNILSDSHL